ncbi:MAG: uracil-DNA glycosylase, partial [Phycisphaerales bacterium]|nr:uracil-DNA glycosylase [Phycisphaerales bacterium]
RTGRPFVGRAGVLLNSMIKAMGLHRHDVYIANVLKVRPPNNATPTTQERAASAPYLFDQIAAIRPQVIVTLGLPASQVVLASDLSMGKLRGVWAEFRHPADAGVVVPVMPTYHPAFLLRSYTPENRNLVWSDLKKVMERLGLKAAKPA